MEGKKMVLTRKIQLLIDCDDKEQRTAYYEKLFKWQEMCFRGANFIFTHLFIQDQIRDIFYLTDDVKVKLVDNQKDEEGILNTSRMNTTYRLLSSYFKGKMPSDIFSNLNNSLYSLYGTERKDYWTGVKSLRSYKKTIPMPFSAKQIKMASDEKGKNFSFTWFGIPFKTYLGTDRSDKRVLLQRHIAGNIKLCTSSIQVKSGKIYFLAAFEMDKQSHALKPNKIAEASLSIEHPIAVQIGKRLFQIGNKEEFLHRRLAIQSARHRLQQGSRYNRPGKGRKRKMKSLDSYAQKEKNYIDSRLHLYSRRLIELCVNNQAGMLLLLNQSAKEDVAKENEFLLRNWSYYGLKEKISYKAKRAGIEIIEE